MADRPAGIRGCGSGWITAPHPPAPAPSAAPVAQRRCGSGFSRDGPHEKPRVAVRRRGPLAPGTSRSRGDREAVILERAVIHRRTQSIADYSVNLNPAVAHAKAPSSPRNTIGSFQHPDHPPVQRLARPAPRLVLGRPHQKLAGRHPAHPLDHRSDRELGPPAGLVDAVAHRPVRPRKASPGVQPGAYSASSHQPPWGRSNPASIPSPAARRRAATFRQPPRRRHSPD